MSRVLWFTVGGSWSPSNHVSLQATRATLVAGPAVTCKSSLSGVLVESRPVLIYEIKLLYVIRLAEYPETVVCAI